MYVEHLFFEKLTILYQTCCHYVVIAALFRGIAALLVEEDFRHG
jgi:hypothetical protein